ncbi:MAG: UDP-galactopyranose mutase, partial [Bacteroidota bacterium]
GIKIPILKLRETDDTELKFLADFIYGKVFYGYTLKQWQMSPEELDFSVSSRVPVSISHDDRYFQDTYQQLPKTGYTGLFENLLKHKNIETVLEIDYKNISNEISFNRLIFTGPIDEYFDFIHGRLPYRSLDFKFKSLNQKWYQETAQVNFPNEFEYTRITEFKHFRNEDSEHTVIAFEYPQNFINGVNEPYYPIPQKRNEDILNKYLHDAEKLSNSVVFIGRLANYKYFNMDEIIGSSLITFNKKIANFY